MNQDSLWKRAPLNWDLIPMTHNNYPFEWEDLEGNGRYEFRSSNPVMEDFNLVLLAKDNKIVELMIDFDNCVWWRRWISEGETGYLGL